MAKRGRGRPRKSISGDGADFFKVFVPALSSDQLMIPPDFVKDFKRTMKEKVVLKNSSGKNWHVDVKETPEGLFLTNGWQSFVNHHSLKLGEFLVFEYDKCYTFVVKIYGTNGCKKEASEGIVTDVKIKRERVDETEDIQTSNKRPRVGKDDRLLIADERNQHSEKFGEENELREQIVASKESENAECALRECPSFVSPPIERKYKLRIPDDLIRKHNLRLEPQMVLRNEDGKKWTVKTFHQSGALFLGKGWFAFQVENNLGSKDRCKLTFERSSRTINVQILTSDPSLSRRGRGRPKKNIASNNVVQEEVKLLSEAVPYSYKLPEFFKLYIPALCSQTARIPPAFMKKFGENIPKVCTLKALPGGASWQVYTNKVDNYWFFQKGWPEFVDDNSLEDSDFLSFSYAGESTFYVKVFTRNCCRKIAENVDDKPTENKACLPENPTNKRNTRRSIIPMGGESVVENPSFEMFISKSHIALSFLTVPMWFWREFLSRKKGSKTVTLRMKNKEWRLTLKVKTGRIMFIGDEMVNFFTDNSLKNGKLCTFHMIDSNNLAFQVTVAG